MANNQNNNLIFVKLMENIILPFGDSIEIPSFQEVTLIYITNLIL